jgi:7-cyano-7-deazaguanine synthase in queuosine biosynthesis
MDACGTSYIHVWMHVVVHACMHTLFQVVYPVKEINACIHACIHTLYRVAYMDTYSPYMGCRGEALASCIGCRRRRLTYTPYTGNKCMP